MKTTYRTKFALCLASAALFAGCTHMGPSSSNEKLPLVTIPAQ